MADNIKYTEPGTGTTLATKDIGGAHYSKTLITNDAGVIIPGDATNGLDVDVTRVQGTVSVLGPVTDAELRLTPIDVNLATVAGAVPVTDNGGSLTVDFAALPAGTNNIGDVGVLSLPALPAGANSIGTTPGPTLTKGTQGTVGHSVQQLKDAGRNAFNLFMVAPIAATNAEVLMSLTGFSMATGAVAATTTPAVVPAGKTRRLVSMVINAQAIAAATAVMVRVRINTGGVGAVGSPLAFNVYVPANPAATAGLGNNASVIPFPDGFELPAGAGLVVTIQGYSATAAAAAGPFTHVVLFGFDY